MAKEKKKIVCDFGAGREIAKDYKITVQAVSRALNFKSTSLQANEIRKLALKKYHGTLVITKRAKRNNKSK